MGIIWTLATVRGASLVEFGCMGHMLYSRVTLERAGVRDACKLYSTHIDETDIALGSADRLYHTVKHVVNRDKSKVIFLTPSSVPEIIGVDLFALSEELQREYPNVHFLPFGYGGFDVTQHQGVKEALLLLAKALPVDIEKTARPTFNIIGSCADLFRFQADARELVRILRGGFGMEPLCVLTSDTSLEDIKAMGGAHVNLVIRQEGEPAAKHLQERFGTPYLLERPYGIEGTARWLERIEQILSQRADGAFIDAEREFCRRRLAPVMPHFRHIVRSHPDEATLSLGGHADVVKGILSFGCGELSFIKGTCWCDCPGMGNADVPYFSEDQWTEAVKAHQKGYLMASGEALEWAGRDRDMQISNPDTKWHLHPYEPPLVGFRGAVHLANMWINESYEA